MSQQDLVDMIGMDSFKGSMFEKSAIAGARELQQQYAQDMMSPADQAQARALATPVPGDPVMTGDAQKDYKAMYDARALSRAGTGYGEAQPSYANRLNMRQPEQEQLSQRELYARNMENAYRKRYGSLERMDPNTGKPIVSSMPPNLAQAARDKAKAAADKLAAEQRAKAAADAAAKANAGKPSPAPDVPFTKPGAAAVAALGSTKEQTPYEYKAMAQDINNEVDPSVWSEYEIPYESYSTSQDSPLVYGIKQGFRGLGNVLTAPSRLIGSGLQGLGYTRLVNRDVADAYSNNAQKSRMDQYLRALHAKQQLSNQAITMDPKQREVLERDYEGLFQLDPTGFEEGQRAKLLAQQQTWPKVIQPPPPVAPVQATAPVIAAK